jgi:Mycothiol-dependent nitroreductase Rv2466c
MTATADFFVDPICPFCWITSRWAVEVADQIDLELRWKFIALKVINEENGYANYPPGYEHGHTGGFRQLRVMAQVRADLGNESVGRLYTELGTRNHNLGLRKNFADEPLKSVANPLIEASLQAAGLPADLIEAASDASLDVVLKDESAEALRRTGPDVGTPIITFAPDTDGAMSFFGPVLSEIPRGQAAVDLWHLVEAIAKVPGFAELKRSLRDKPNFD